MQSAHATRLALPFGREPLRVAYKFISVLPDPRQSPIPRTLLLEQAPFQKGSGTNLLLLLFLAETSLERVKIIEYALFGHYGDGLHYGRIVARHLFGRKINVAWNPFVPQIVCMQVRIAPPLQEPLTQLARINKRTLPKEVEAAVEWHLQRFSETIREAKRKK